MTQPGYDINVLYQEVQTRWLKPAEVLFILQNHEKYQLTNEPPQRPTGGSLFLFNKRILRFFRRDGHNWRKKKDGRTVGEAHERLKVGNVEALNCYYAHGEDNPNFQRRSYWILDPAYEHIVLVHYRDISERKSSFESIPQLSPDSSTFSQSPSSNTTQNLGSILDELYETYQNLSSPGSAEVSSDTVISNNNEIKHLEGVDRTGKNSSSTELEVSEALRRLEVQLSLNDESIKDFGPFIIQGENLNDLGSLDFEREISEQEQYAALLHGSEYATCDQLYSGHAIKQNDSSDLLLLQLAGDNEKHHQSLEHEYAVESKESLPWKEMLESYNNSSGVGAQERYMLDEHQKTLLSSAKSEPAEEKEYFQWSNLDGSNVGNSSVLLPQDVENFNFSTYPPLVGAPKTNPNYYTMLFDEVQIGIPFEADPSLTIAYKQKYTIQEISPEWGYASEATKVIIVGSFLCDPSESAWTCMFGDIEVPLQIIQQGVIRCEAPPNSPGKVTLCITSGNRESCSEVREFEYRIKTSDCTHCNSLQPEDTKSPEELLLVVRFVQMLQSDTSMQNGGGIESGLHLLRKLNADDESWDYAIEALLDGSGTSSGTINWLLEELLQDKLQKWLSSRSSEAQDRPGCSLSKKEQGIIHMVAGLGFEWALNPILSHGVSINFRDINGWTALHWAARFGRERIVAALIASGASAGAVTDPTSQDPTGKTAASIAAAAGHKGLAGYLSEVSLTSHLSSLTLEESELSKGSAEVEAEITVNSISEERLAASEDQLSLKDTLAAVRNAAQAAARIQSAFRAHSFRRRQQWEAAADYDYSINPNDVRGISALSKMTFGSARDRNSAALSIQKKYRGWKGRKDFLALRRKVVKIQAHVRGYQVRKNYKVICWAVGILDKVVLRWRRKGVGLRGFRHETECIDESEDEDILTVFRKQKVDAAIDEAVSRVLSMVDSSDARQQYRRMLEKYRQAKAELNTTSEAAASTSLGDMYNFP